MGSLLTSSPPFHSLPSPPHPHISIFKYFPLSWSEISQKRAFLSSTGKVRSGKLSDSVIWEGSQVWGFCIQCFFKSTFPHWFVDSWEHVPVPVSSRNRNKRLIICPLSSQSMPSTYASSLWQALFGPVNFNMQMCLFTYLKSSTCSMGIFDLKLSHSFLLVPQ